MTTKTTNATREIPVFTMAQLSQIDDPMMLLTGEPFDRSKMLKALGEEQPNIDPEEERRQALAFTSSSDVAAVADVIKTASRVEFLMDARDGRPRYERHDGPRTIRSIRQHLAKLSDNGRLWTMLLLDGYNVRLGGVRRDEMQYFFRHD